MFSFFLQPMIWIVMLVFLGVWLKKGIFKKRLIKAALVLFLIFTNTVIFSEFTRLWEVDGAKIEDVGHYDLGIVLGGMSEYNNDLDRLSIRRGGDRIWQAIQLYRAKKIDKILISGAHGNIIDKGLVEATQLKSDLVRLGIPEEDILTESKSHNTHENAVETKIIIDKMDRSPTILLITSAIHMKRAEACFRSEGFLNFDTFSTDHFTGENRGYQFDQYFIPNVWILSTWNLLIKEWVGYAVYNIMGYV